MRYVSHKHMKAVATDLKAIYSASTESDAEFNLELFAFPEDIRRIIYTTNATPVGEHDAAQGDAQSSHLSLR